MAALTAVGALLLSTPVPAAPHSGITLSSGFGAPVAIDGTMSPGEWDGTEPLSVFGGGLGGSLLYVMNDNTNLYIALRVVGDATFTNFDAIDMRFDNGHNGTNTNGDDEAYLNSDTYRDAHYDAGWDIADAMQHGTGAAGTAGGVNVFEVSKPLDSGDPDDISVAPNQTFGFCIKYYVNGGGDDSSTAPIGCFFSKTQDGYADVTVASSPEGDANCNGTVDSIDSLIVLQAVAGLLPEIPCPDEADADNNKTIDAIDAVLILQYVVGLLPALPPP